MTTTAPSTAPSGRIEAPDALRGLIMLLMALDHAAYFVSGHHATEIWGLPVPVHPNALAFVTRLVSHLCAPGFFLLMGAGMTLFASSRRARGWSERRILRHFAVRGFVLIVVDLVLASPPFLIASLGDTIGGPSAPIPGESGPIYMGYGVLAALGAAMMFGGLLVRVGALGSAAVGLAVVLTCQALVPGPEHVPDPYPIWLRVLLIPGQTGGFLTIYSIAPWFGVCALGMAAGEWLRRDSQLALRWAPAAGALALLLFLLVRMVGGFGNTHTAASFGWLDVLAVTKYPPSIAFLLLTLGVDLVLLGGFARLAGTRGLGSWAWPLLVLGRTPLFFYILHLWLYCAIGWLIPGDTTLLAMYPIWLGGIALLLPLCARYQRFKQGQPAESVWRLF